MTLVEKKNEIKNVKWVREGFKEAGAPQGRRMARGSPLSTQLRLEYKLICSVNKVVRGFGKGLSSALF